MDKSFRDIYRGYVIDYSKNAAPKPYYCCVRATDDGPALENCMSFDSACDWIDKKVREERK